MNQRRRFRILETVGKGGFGTVYRAEMVDAGGFSKVVALKVMHYEGEAAEDIARRLRDEARVLGLIRHRAVVGANSLVPLDNGWGVVMDYIEGVDLSSAIKEKALPPITASIEIIEEVASALDTAYNTRAHDTGEKLQLVHRDIKPSNIRITRQGEVKLLDFGVAQARFMRKEAVDQGDFVLGSVRYMAPERRRGVEGHTGDVYALGVVLANLITGKRFAEPPEVEADHATFVGTVLQTVRASLSAQEHSAMREVEGPITRLLLEMLSFEPSDRPDAATVERRCRRLRAQLPAPWLRDWADTAVARLLGRAPSERKKDSDTGRILAERTGDDPSSVSRVSRRSDRSTRVPTTWSGSAARSPDRSMRVPTSVPTQERGDRSMRVPASGPPPERTGVERGRTTTQPPIEKARPQPPEKPRSAPRKAEPSSLIERWSSLDPDRRRQAVIGLIGGLMIVVAILVSLVGLD